MGQTVNLLVYTFGGSNPSSPTLLPLESRGHVLGSQWCYICVPGGVIRAERQQILSVITHQRKMVQASDISAFVAHTLEGTPYFPVAVDPLGTDGFAVLIDSAAPVDIDFCASLTHKIRDHFGSDLDDCNLEVGSAGLTAPFRVRGQYIKNLGNEIEVLTNTGRKLHGPLSAVDADTFTIEVTEKRRVEDRKKPVEFTEQVQIPFADVKTARIILKF